MPLQLDDLDLLGAPNAGEGGKPLALPIDSIDEDPAQPRKEFEEGVLQELADTIAERGVKQPISVRPHPDAAGRWLLNFGARRLRASKLAGKHDIPAFVDETADSYDQVIENEQREPLKPLELALFVQRRIAAGDSQADIARRLGKSRQYITLATALIDPPDWLLCAYREGRCRGMTELYELRKLHGEGPADVEAWATDGEPITRERIAGLRNTMNDRKASALIPAVDAAVNASAGPTRSADVPGAGTVVPIRPEQPRHRLEVELDGVAVELIVGQVPPLAGEVFIRGLAGGARRVVAASQLKLLGFVPR